MFVHSVRFQHQAAGARKGPQIMSSNGALSMRYARRHSDTLPDPLQVVNEMEQRRYLRRTA